MNASLLCALRTVRRADSDPVRETLFANVRARSGRVQLAESVFDSLGSSAAASALVAAYGLGCFFTYTRPRTRAPLLAVAAYPNEAQAVDDIASHIGADRMARIRLRVAAPPSTAWRLDRWAPDALRAFRTLRRVHAGRSFLVSCRLASAIACYLRAAAIIADHRPAATLVASDYNPESVGLTWAARGAGLPTIFVSHSHTHHLSPRLRFDLSILDGQAALARYAAKGPVDGRVVFRGIAGPSRPMDPARLLRPSPVVGVFPPKEIVWPTLARIVADLQEHFAARVILRWHPNMLERPRPGPWSDGTIEVSASGAPLTDAAARCDWAVADENSSVHLPVLKQGVPTVTIADLGVFPRELSDFYGFVADAVIPAPVARVDRAGLLAAAALFGDRWIERFRRYDPAYLTDPELLHREMRRALLDILESPAATSRSACARSPR